MSFGSPPLDARLGTSRRRVLQYCRLAQASRERQDIHARTRWNRSTDAYAVCAHSPSGAVAPHDGFLRSS